jgi:hypothetical protein
MSTETKVITDELRQIIEECLRIIKGNKANDQPHR